MPKGIYPRKSIQERFWEKVDIKGESECWEWKSSLDRHGYGAFGLNGKTVRAHRVAYILTHGEITDDIHILHTCDNPPCCNPAHLWEGTNADNTHDKMIKGRYIIINGIRHGSHKLTEQDVLEIRNKRRHGYTTTSLADQYDIDQSEISRICSRKNWKHI